MFMIDCPVHARVWLEVVAVRQKSKHYDLGQRRTFLSNCSRNTFGFRLIISCFKLNPKFDKLYPKPSENKETGKYQYFNNLLSI